MVKDYTKPDIEVLCEVSLDVCCASKQPYAEIEDYEIENLFDD